LKKVRINFAIDYSADYVCGRFQQNADVAQLVERNLAKVEHIGCATKEDKVMITLL